MSRVCDSPRSGIGRALRIVLGVMALSLGGCFSDHPSEPTNPGTTVSFSADIQPILNGGCAFSGCHGTTNANPSNKPMVLTSAQAYDNIVGVASAQLPSMQRIRAGQPDQSYLIHKLQGTHITAGGSGGRMPLGSTPLSQATIDRIRAWVTNGAPRN
jgi:hypothetical protein